MAPNVLEEWQMTGFDTDPTVVTIKNRAKASGLNLDLYIDHITNTWKQTPMGFGFVCKDGAYRDLLTALIVNKHFGCDNMIGGSQHKGVSYREDSRPDSLHIVLSKRPDANMANANCSIHLDSVSVVLGVDSKTGMVKYDMGKILQHVTTDLAHMPLMIVPGGDGIKFGIRF